MTITSTPQVSVVIPTRDRKAIVQKTAACVLAQVDVDVEVVVVDDGSDDGTADWLYAHEDPRVRPIVHSHSLGVSRARNTGIEAASAPLVALLDDDDLWHPRKLSRQVQALETTGAGWGYSSAVHFLPDLTLWRRDPAPSVEVMHAGLPWENIVPAGASNVIIRRSVLDEVGLFALDLAHMADWDMWLRLLRTGPPAPVADFDVAYRLHRSNWALGDDSGILAEAAVIDERFADLRGAPLSLVPIYRWLATSNWRGGQRVTARSYWFRAMKEGDRAAVLRLVRSLVPVTRLRPTGVNGSGIWPQGSREWVAAADCVASNAITSGQDLDTR